MTDAGQSQLRIEGYSPGVIGRITELHATYYHEHWGFDHSFETQVGRELSEFMARLERGRDGFWAAALDRVFAGSIAVDGCGADAEGARIRWFIVHPGHRARGIGTTLLKGAVDFCASAGHRRIHLWTFRGLDAARSLYEKAGFRLSEEHDRFQWGREIREQKFELHL